MYVPTLKPVIVDDVPEPFIPPGLIVQFPNGKLLSITLPVATVQVGWVIVPTTGDVGITDVIIIFDEAGEVHPTELVTVKLYVPAINPVKVVLEVLPASDTGLMVQFPDGSPDISTLPVAVAHVGCVTAPGIGAVGVTG